MPVTLTATQISPPSIEDALRVITDPRRLMTAKEVGAQLLNCSAKTVGKYRREEGLPAIRFGGEYRYKRESVLNWIDEREERRLR